jgi:spermidine/putrescine transport system permease protein
VRQRRPAPHRAGRTRLKPARGLLALPPTLYLIALLIVPIILLGMYSVFLLTNLIGVTSVFSWAGWTDFFPSNPFTWKPWSTDSVYWNRFVLSMGVTLIVSIVVTIMAYPLAYFLAFVSQRRRYVLLFIMLAPFFTSFLLRVLAWQVMLNDNGVVNSALWRLGLLHDGHALEIFGMGIFRTWFSIGLVLGYTWIPFVALPMFVVLENMDRRLIEAAQDLGASRFGTFLRVTLPLSLPGVIAGFVFVLIPTTGEFVTPQLVGGSDTYMFGNAIQDFFLGSQLWNQGAVLAVWLMVVVVVLIALSARFLVMDLREGTE